MRSQEAILKRIKEREEHDPLGFEAHEYMLSLDFEHVKPFLIDGISESEWTQNTPDRIRANMQEYMPFAIEKAEKERGISANRSIMHYIAWLWLVEEDELLAKVEHEYNTNYHSFGLPILKMIDDHFGWGNELKGVFP